jgi:hypothetical protein
LQLWNPAFVSPLNLFRFLFSLKHRLHAGGRQTTGTVNAER